MTIPLQTRTVYGPLTSRRFGRSLGINALPCNARICNLNCVYCQYTNKSLASSGFPSPEEIGQAALARLKSASSRGEAFDWIMFSGNGEATLHPQFAEVVDRVLEARNRYFPKVPVGILSNSTTCWRRPVREALLRLDGRFMKLDAGSPRLFRAANGPAGSADWDRVIEGLRRMGHMVLQSLFFAGPVTNVSEEDIDDWVRAVRYVKPESVQIYSIDRPPREESLSAVPGSTLEAIASRLSAASGVPALVYA